MVTMLNRKTGLPLPDGIDFLNEAFRKVNQMSKGGFIWQRKQTTLVVPAGAIVPVALPADFDPGKSAWLFGNAITTPTATEIPYASPSEFVNEQHFNTNLIGGFSVWTFQPNFTFGPPTSYGWNMLLAPNDAYPLPNPVNLGFFYHAVSFPPFTAANDIFFPTPDEFDNMIVDLAIAEVRNVYRMSGEEGEVEKAIAAIAAIIDTYRSNRYSLAGLSDVAAQAQEDQLEKGK
jgi:hypothetical protein